METIGKSPWSFEDPFWLAKPQSMVDWLLAYRHSYASGCNYLDLPNILYVLCYQTLSISARIPNPSILRIY